MKQRTPLLNEPVELACRRLALTFLNQVVKTLPRLSKPEDDEALHDFRVNIRRLRTCLRSYRPHFEKRVAKRLRKQLGKLMSGTNESRDAEVQLAWLKKESVRKLPKLQAEGIRIMLEQLQASGPHEEDRTQLATKFTQLEHALRERLMHSTRAARLDASGHSLTFAEATGVRLQADVTLLREQFGGIGGAQDQALAHQARLTVKRLRYLLEPLRKDLKGANEAVRQLKRLQDVLGELQDLHTLELRVHAALEEAGAAHTRKLLQAALTAQQLTIITRTSQELHASQALAALLMLIRKRQAKRFATFQKRWLDAGHPLFERLEAVTMQLAPIEPVS